jgi:hypothetical protein
MTTVQRVTQILGWVFVVVAVWGAVISGTVMESDPALAPLLLGLFPVNFLHNLVHLLFGIWALRAARSVDDSRTFSVVAGSVFLGLAALGLLIPDGLGALPLGSHDIWLHAVFGLVLVATGVVASARAADTFVEPGRTRTVLPPTLAATMASSPDADLTLPPIEPDWPEGRADPSVPGRATPEEAAAAAPPSAADPVVDEEGPGPETDEPTPGRESPDESAERKDRH